MSCYGDIFEVAYVSKFHSFNTFGGVEYIAVNYNYRGRFPLDHLAVLYQVPPYSDSIQRTAYVSIRIASIYTYIYIFCV